MDSGGVSRGKSVDVAVGCLHFNVTSMALQWHFHGTSMAFQRYFNKRKKKSIGASIRIGQERVGVSCVYPCLAILTGTDPMPIQTINGNVRQLSSFYVDPS